MLRFVLCAVAKCEIISLKRNSIKCSEIASDRNYHQKASRVAFCKCVQANAQRDRNVDTLNPPKVEPARQSLNQRLWSLTQRHSLCSILLNSFVTPSWLLRDSFNSIESIRFNGKAPSQSTWFLLVHCIRTVLIFKSELETVCDFFSGRSRRWKSMKKMKQFWSIHRFGVP